MNDLVKAQKTFEQEQEDWMNHVVMKIHGKDVTQRQLVQAFDKVKNAEHWKNPINARIRYEDDFELEMIFEAVIYLTGSVPRISTYKHNKAWVRADGYFLTIGA